MLLYIIENFAFFLNVGLIIYFLFDDNKQKKDYWLFGTNIHSAIPATCCVFVLTTLGASFDLISIEFVKFMNHVVLVVSWCWLLCVVLKNLKKESE